MSNLMIWCGVTYLHPEALLSELGWIWYLLGAAAMMVDAYRVKSYVEEGP